MLAASFLNSSTLATKSPRDNGQVVELPKGMNHSIVVWLGLTMLVGVTGNAFMVYVFGYRVSEVKKTRFHSLYKDAAIFDLVFCVITPLLLIVQRLHPEYSTGGNQALGGIVFMVIHAYIFTSQAWLVLLGVERYRGFVTPFKLEFGWKIKTVCICSAIAMSILLTIPSLATMEVEYCTKSTCSNGNEVLLWKEAQVVVCLVITCLTITITSSLTIQAVRSLIRKDEFVTEQIIAHRLQRFHGTLLICVAIISLFTVCTIPWLGINLTLVIKCRLRPKANWTSMIVVLCKARTYLQVFMTAYSSLKPPIFIGLHKSFEIERNKMITMCHWVLNYVAG